MTRLTLPYAPPSDTPLDGLAQELVRALRGMRYGSLEIVVHDGRVVQWERRERQRLDRPPSVSERD